MGRKETDDMELLSFYGGAIGNPLFIELLSNSERYII